MATPTFGRQVLERLELKVGHEISGLYLPAASVPATDWQLGNNFPVYSLTPASPGTLTFNAATRELSGTVATPAANANYTLSARGPDGSVANLVFEVEVVA